MGNKIDENKVYKLAFDVIEDSLNWLDENGTKGYSDFIDGVITMSKKIISEFDKKENYNESQRQI